VRVARALEKLPRVAAAMECGKLNYSKAREITRIACPENEEYLLMIAEHGSAQHVEKLVRAYRRCQDAEELSREACQQRDRRVSFRYEDDGSLMLTCRLPAEVGALVMKALDLAVEKLPPDPYVDVPAGTCGVLPTRIPFSQRRADALALIAESFVGHEILEAPGTDRHQIVVHVAAETLRDRQAGCCEFEHGPSMPAETARRLSCDASVVHLYESDKSEPLNLGRKTRTVSAPLRRFLSARDKGCRFPGCCNSRYIDAHHIKHWANGGETRPSNLVSLCRFHHRAVHEGGIRIEILDDGALRFVKANGEAISYIASGDPDPSSDWQDIVRDQHQRPSQWRGDSVDYGLAVEILMQRSMRPRDVPAGT
jgi:hypothetical protein